MKTNLDMKSTGQYCRVWRPGYLSRLFFWGLIAALPLCPQSITAEEPTSTDESTRKNFKLPGLVIDFEKRCVDIESTVCLNRGTLELIACTKRSKEHESLVAIEARPMHVHTALLLLGSNPGNPAMRKAVDEEKTRWVHLPPRGDLVDVYLVLENKEGKAAEHPIGKFITRTEESLDELGADKKEKKETGKESKFPHTFLFAGSLLRSDGLGPRKYVSDISGNVISIATFGDELLCLPGVHAHENQWLLWQIDATHLPKVGTKVTLRLRPKKAKPSKAKPTPKQRP